MEEDDNGKPSYTKPKGSMHNPHAVEEEDEEIIINHVADEPPASKVPSSSRKGSTELTATLQHEVSGQPKQSQRASIVNSSVSAKHSEKLKDITSMDAPEEKMASNKPTTLPVASNQKSVVASLKSQRSMLEPVGEEVEETPESLHAQNQASSKTRELNKILNSSTAGEEELSKKLEESKKDVFSPSGEVSGTFTTSRKSLFKKNGKTNESERIAVQEVEDRDSVKTVMPASSNFSRKNSAPSQNLVVNDPSKNLGEEDVGKVQQLKSAKTLTITSGGIASEKASVHKDENTHDSDVPEVVKQSSRRSTSGSVKFSSHLNRLNNVEQLEEKYSEMLEKKTEIAEPPEFSETSVKSIKSAKSPGKPTSPSETPSNAPSQKVSAVHSEKQSNAPSQKPSITPWENPSTAPSEKQSTAPWEIPSTAPSQQPSTAPWENSSTEPSQKTANAPWEKPSTAPSQKTTNATWEKPSTAPWDNPSTVPSQIPSTTPWENPSTAPYQKSSTGPWENPSTAPSQKQSTAPWENPSTAPSEKQSSAPWEKQSSAPWEKQSSGPWEKQSSGPWEKQSSGPWEKQSTAPSKNSHLEPVADASSEHAAKSPLKSETASTKSAAMTDHDVSQRSVRKGSDEGSTELNRSNSYDGYEISPEDIFNEIKVARTSIPTEDKGTNLHSFIISKTYSSENVVVLLNLRREKNGEWVLDKTIAQGLPSQSYGGVVSIDKYDMLDKPDPSAAVKDKTSRTSIRSLKASLSQTLPNTGENCNLAEILKKLEEDVANVNKEIQAARDVVRKSGFCAKQNAAANDADSCKPLHFDELPFIEQLVKIFDMYLASEDDDPCGITCGKIEPTQNGWFGGFMQGVSDVRPSTLNETKKGVTSGQAQTDAVSSSFKDPVSHRQELEAATSTMESVVTDYTEDRQKPDVTLEEQVTSGAGSVLQQNNVTSSFQDEFLLGIADADSLLDDNDKKDFRVLQSVSNAPSAWQQSAINTTETTESLQNEGKGPSNATLLLKQPPQSNENESSLITKYPTASQIPMSPTNQEVVGASINPSSFVANVESTKSSSVAAQVQSLKRSSAVANIESSNPSSVEAKVQSSKRSSAVTNVESSQPSSAVTNVESSQPSSAVANVESSKPISVAGKVESSNPSGAVANVESSNPSSVSAQVRSSKPSAVANVESSKPSGAVANVESSKPSSVSAKVESSKPSGVVANVESSKPSSVSAKVESSKPSGVVANVESSKTSSVAAKVKSSQPSSVSAKVESVKPSTAVANVESSKPSVAKVESTKPSSVSAKVESSKPSGVVNNVESSKPSSVAAKVESSKPNQSVPSSAVTVSKPGSQMSPPSQAAVPKAASTAAPSMKASNVGEALSPAGAAVNAVGPSAKSLTSNKAPSDVQTTWQGPPLAPASSSAMSKTTTSQPATAVPSVASEKVPPPSTNPSMASAVESTQISIEPKDEVADFLKKQ